MNCITSFLTLKLNNEKLSFTPIRGLTETWWLNVSLPLCAICGKTFSYDCGKRWNPNNTSQFIYLKEKEKMNVCCSLEENPFMHDWSEKFYTNFAMILTLNWMSTNGKYLVFLMLSRVKCSDFVFIMEKINSRLDG